MKAGIAVTAQWEARLRILSRDIPSSTASLSQKSPCSILPGHSPTFSACLSGPSPLPLTDLEICRRGQPVHRASNIQDRDFLAWSPKVDLCWIGWLVDGTMWVEKRRMVTTHPPSLLACGRERNKNRRYFPAGWKARTKQKHRMCSSFFLISPTKAHHRTKQKNPGIAFPRRDMESHCLTQPCNAFMSPWEVGIWTEIKQNTELWNPLL